MAEARDPIRAPMREKAMSSLLSWRGGWCAQGHRSVAEWLGGVAEGGLSKVEGMLQLQSRRQEVG